MYKYLNSKDVKDYLKKIRYKFNPLESAFIIKHNDYLSLKDKHLAYKELIKKTKDIEIPKRRLCAHFNSLHKFLLDYIELENKLLKEFNKKDKAAYKITYHLYDEELLEYEHIEDDVIYDSVSKCLKQAKNNKYFNDYYRITISKMYLNNDSKLFSITYSKDDKPLKINEWNILRSKKEKDIYYLFDGLWFNIPVPFKKGDIVKNSIIHSGYSVRPFVLSDTINNINNEVVILDGDNVDMCAYGYFKDDKDYIFYEGMDNYIDLKYCVAESKVLNLLSSYLIGETKLKDVIETYKKSISNNCKVDELKKELKQEKIYNRNKR